MPITPSSRWEKAGYLSVDAAGDDRDLGLADGPEPAVARSRRGGRWLAAAATLLGAVVSVLVIRNHAGSTQVEQGHVSTTSTDHSLELAAIVQKSELAPFEPMHDGNVCDIAEEVFGGLCYKKCSMLTSGVAPLRTSSWTCCESQPCTPQQTMGSIGHSLLCQGYDVSGDGSCPHKPGACLVDEELYLGICYKTCGLITNGAFQHRVAPATCCKTEGWGCMNPQNYLMDKALDVGGGAGDSDSATPAFAHPPMQRLTEEADASGTFAPVATSAPSAAGVPTPPPALSLGGAEALATLQPSEHMHDGNVCDDREEYFGGLCYAKCSALTHGQAPIRTSSWTCCKSEPCRIWNSRGSIGGRLLCNGFDVSGEGACPHKPGACLTDEELYLGVCYKKCRVLTNGAFPYRFAAATCCKVEGWGCLNSRNDEMSAAFDVGGGGGDHDASTPGFAHAPQQRLTEGAMSTTAAAAPRAAADEAQAAARLGSSATAATTTAALATPVPAVAASTSMPSQTSDSHTHEAKAHAEPEIPATATKAMGLAKAKAALAPAPDPAEEEDSRGASSVTVEMKRRLRTRL
mmetsp:Transcript_58011/g.188789  ORF Transcript_58011/g.188789 Transcript_58011/m.188789 type:complete len:575 (+) Transcript_58011:89-1813(+)